MRGQICKAALSKSATQYGNSRCTELPCISLHENLHLYYRHLSVSGSAHPSVIHTVIWKHHVLGLHCEELKIGEIISLKNGNLTSCSRLYIHLQTEQAVSKCKQINKQGGACSAAGGYMKWSFSVRNEQEKNQE